jgi:hypothetical protein
MTPETYRSLYEIAALVAILGALLALGVWAGMMFA